MRPYNYTPVQKAKEKGDITLREKDLHDLPFGALKSRLAVATMLSYFGDKDEVHGLMRVMSHKTRAYIKNADGLKGFLITSSITQLLKQLVGSQELEKLSEY